MYERLQGCRLGIHEGSKKVDACDVCTHWVTELRPKMAATLNEVFSAIRTYESELHGELMDWWEPDFLEEPVKLRELLERVRTFVRQKPHTHMALEWEIFEEKTKTKNKNKKTNLGFQCQLCFQN